MNNKENFNWKRHPEAEAYLSGCLSQLVSRMPKTQAFTTALAERTGSRLVDWVDHLVIADGDLPRGQVHDLGFEQEQVPVEPANTVYYHPGAAFPRIVLQAEEGVPPATPLAVAIQVEEISHFVLANQLAVPIEGSPLSPYRRATAWTESGGVLLVVERRGHAGFIPTTMPPEYEHQYVLASERWATRPRLLEDERTGMQGVLALARSLVSDVGTDVAAWLAFAAERTYWLGRNRAGQVQRAAQDSLGLGWANHDHHTFRSSRASFPVLIQILETFGFRTRERFYAGAEAGWGAQVMEQPVCRFAVFADVDLSPEEVEGDFAHEPLRERTELGTVGLWCALHGDSMLSAGLHHLAALFDFDAVTARLDEQGISTMRPFSDFTYLRQAFTRGELWPVAPGRLERLVATGSLEEGDQTRFAERGAIGSHLENIQRGEGFKGFNQQKVSDIIRRTDPRSQERIG